MSWDKELDQVARRRELAYRMGGPEKVERQHANGKLTVRERIDRLLDAGSFREVGTIAGSARYYGTQLIDFLPADQVVGHGSIDARPVAVVGDDFTVRGGAADASVYEKLLYPERLGARSEDADRATGGRHGRRRFGAHARTQGLHIPCRRQPPCLDGNGTVDDEVESEDAAFARTRRFLSYLPRSVYELPPRTACDDDPQRREEMLLSVVPHDERKVYAMRPIVEALVDHGSFFEIGRLWGAP